MQKARTRCGQDVARLVPPPRLAVEAAFAAIHPGDNGVGGALLVMLGAAGVGRWGFIAEAKCT